MVDVFDEVDEDLRAERLRALLLRYGAVAIALMLASLLAVGGWQAWRWHQGRRADASATAYSAAARLADQPGAEDQARAASGFEAVIGSGTESYRVLARLRAAALRASAGDLSGAAALWNAVAADRNADTLQRDLATLLWAQHEVGRGDPAAIAARLKPLAAVGNPFHGLATESVALLDLQTGRTAEARTALQGLLADPAVPDGVRDRAGMLLTRLGG